MHAIGCGGNVTCMFIKNRPSCFVCLMMTDVLTNFIFAGARYVYGNCLLNSLPVGEIVY